MASARRRKRFKVEEDPQVEEAPQAEEAPQIEEAPSSFKSAVWEHFGFSVQYDDEGKKTAKKQSTVCKHCHITVAYSSGNTSNMMTHLRRHHPAVSLAGRAGARTVHPLAKTQQSLIAATQKEFATNSEKHKEITKAVGVFIAKNLQPYSVVTDSGFRHLMKKIEPRYNVPSSTYFSSEVIPELYETLRREIENELTQTPYQALSTDIWTSRPTESYLTVTVHYVLDWEVKSYVLQTRPLYENHTSAHLALELMNVVTEWKLERKNTTIPVTTDNTQNILNAIREADGFGPHVGCFAHILNLAAKRAFSLKAVSRLLGKVRKVVTFFHESTIAHQALAVKQEMLDIPKHKLIHDVTTHWITIHDMLERYVEQQPAIYSAVLDKAVKKSAKDIAMLTDNELKLAEELVQLLNPLKTMTTLLSSETSPTSSMILPLKTMALKSMAPGPEDSATIREVKAAFTQDLERRYKDPDLLDYLHRATALDPRFKSLPFLHEACFDRVYKDLVNKIVEREFQFEAVQCKRPSSSSPPQKKITMSNLFGELFKVEEQAKPFSKIIEEEVTSYKMADCLHVDADPFAWWKTNQSKFPYVAKLAQQCLSVPGTSVASERVFSTAGDIVGASRSRLASENVDMLMFLQKNLNVKE